MEPTERKVLSVFVASPNDLSEERRALREVVERLNKLFGKRIGWQVELLGWEDTLLGFSRPQALINKDVEVCHLFVGVMWKRWGTDSGEYSSGFEEEFTIARKRRLAGGKPEIWMFFKHIDDELYKDPGEQLRRVIEFKTQLIEKKELLFKEFEDAKAFRDLVHDALSAFVMDLHAEAQKATEVSETESPQTKDSPVGRAKQIDACEETNPQLTEIFSKLSECLGGGKEAEIGYWERIRAYLSTSALYSQSHTGELFGIHEINLAYVKRTEWSLTENERWLLIRTFFGDNSNVSPGWYWLSGMSVSEIENTLSVLAEDDRDGNVRKGALSTFLQAATCPSLDTIRHLVNDADESIVIESIKLLRFSEDKGALKILEPLINHRSEGIQKGALSVYLDSLYQYDPEESFKALKDKGVSVSDGYRSAFQGSDLKVSTELLTSAVTEASPRIREFAISYLSKTGALSNDTARGALNDPDSRVRKIAFEWLLNNDVEYSLNEVSKLFPRPKSSSLLIQQDVTEDEMVPLVLAKKSKEELEGLIDFYSVNGVKAYEVLASKYGAEMTERFRSDLQNEFESLKTRSTDKMSSEYGEKAVPAILEVWTQDLRDYMKEQFSSAAIGGLAKFGDKSDIEIARNYIGKLKYGAGDDACISIIEKFGDSSDVSQLIEVADKSYGHRKEKAVLTAIRLSGDDRGAIIELAGSKDKDIAEIAAKQMYLLSREERLSLAKTLLHSEHDKVRLTAARAICKHLGRDEVEQSLNSYIESSTYYYNVVKYFDGYLYAPGKFKLHFSHE